MSYEIIEVKEKHKYYNKNKTIIIMLEEEQEENKSYRIREEDDKKIEENEHIRIKEVEEEVEYWDGINIQNMRIKEIKEKEFKNKRIKQIELPQILEIIKDSSFEGSLIERITIPKNVKYLGERCFENCKQLKVIIFLNEMEEIKKYSFCECNKLKSIQMPKRIKKIGDCAFFRCEKLEEIIWQEKPVEIEELGIKTFGICKTIKELRLPRLKKIGWGCFYSCENLEKMYISEEIEEISYGCFDSSGIRYLNDENKIRIPQKVRIIGEDSFNRCQLISKIEFNKELEEIGESSLWKSSIKRFEPKEGIKRIGNYCLNYSTVEMIRIPKSVERLGDEWCKNCKYLKYIICPKRLEMVYEQIYEWYNEERYNNVYIDKTYEEEGMMKIIINK